MGDKGDNGVGGVYGSGGIIGVGGREEYAVGRSLLRKRGLGDIERLLCRNPDPFICSSS